MRWKHFLRWLQIQLRYRWWSQAAVLGLIWALGELVVWALDWPVPGSFLGLAFLLLALEMRLFSISWFRRGASRLLAHLVLFFVPAMLAVVNHGDLLSMTGLKILLAILLGTLVVMLGTAVVVELAFRLERARER